MNRDQIMALFDAASVADSSTDPEVLVSAFAAISQLQTWCKSQQLAATELLNNLPNPA